MIHKITRMFYNLFRVFVGINLVMIVCAIMNVIQSNQTTFRMNFWFFCILVMNFWIMMILFFLVSISIKFSIVMSVDPSALDENMGWIQTMIVFPLMPSYDDNDEVIRLVMEESINTPAPSRSAPASERLLKMEVKWGRAFRMYEDMSDEQKKEKCLICLQDMEHVFPTMAGVSVLTCNCNTLFHKKCILEWFHFNEKDATEAEPSTVSCPSCRHLFSDNS
jgi:hypothetical protein